MRRAALWQKGLLGAFLVALANGAPAATYYVDCEHGRDGNDGRTAVSAWQTIARANQQSYGPGDSILLRRNCTWHGPGFKASGSGSVAAPILLADYGEANLPLPIIDG